MMVERRIEGLDCPDCAAKLEHALGTVKGVRALTIDFESSKLVTEVDDVSVMEELEEIADCIEPGVRFFGVG